MSVRVHTPDRYGALQPEFSFELGRGYQVLVGANNAGKSAILQLAFRTVAQGGSLSDAVLLTPDRTHVQSTGETGGRTLESYNGELLTFIQHQPLPYEHYLGPIRGELPRLLLTHTDYIGQSRELSEYLAVLSLPQMFIRAGQSMQFPDISIQLQGSGLRSLYTILAALTDPQIRTILIDEPESSLEPRAQKGLRDLLIKWATEDKQVLVATHSHLFLNREEPRLNHVVKSARGSSSTDSITTIETVTSAEELYDITFQLLGNDTEDLFFPGNYLVVEGASDQVIAERVLSLLDVRHTRVKVLAAGGITEVRDRLAAVTASLTPLVMRDSPYSGRVVALVDKPKGGGAHYEKLRRDLRDRLFTLSSSSIEEYMPDHLYQRCYRSKETDLRELERLVGDYAGLREFKRILAIQLAEKLTSDDLDAIPIIRDAAQCAAGSRVPARTTDA